MCVFEVFRPTGPHSGGWCVTSVPGKGTPGCSGVHYKSCHRYSTMSFTLHFTNTVLELLRSNTCMQVWNDLTDHIHCHVGVLSRRSYHILDSHEKRFILIPLPLQWAGSHLVGAFVRSDLQNICIVVFDNIVFKLLYPYNMYNNISLYMANIDNAPALPVNTITISPVRRTHP